MFDDVIVTDKYGAPTMRGEVTRYGLVTKNPDDVRGGLYCWYKLKKADEFLLAYRIEASKKPVVEHTDVEEWYPVTLRESFKIAGKGRFMFEEGEGPHIWFRLSTFTTPNRLRARIAAVRSGWQRFRLAVKFLRRRLRETLEILKPVYRRSARLTNPLRWPGY